MTTAKDAATGETVDTGTGEIIPAGTTATTDLAADFDLDRRAIAQLSAALDLEEEAWIPQPGDEVVGRVITRKDVPSEFPPGHYPMVQILTLAGKIVDVHGFHTVLRAAIEGGKPEYGDLFACRYLGPREGGAFGSYENYRVIVSHVTQG